MSLFLVSSRSLLVSAAFGSVLLSSNYSAIAQSVTSAQDDFNTQITVDGNLYDITGGQVSDDGGNLFHSLEQLNLDAQETANFLTNSQVQNVIGRITNNEVSNIDGTLQVTGSTANLYLLNPAGFLFGSNATLNLPASFTATTATGLGFDSDWFDFSTAAADNLSGVPTAFSFTDKSGAISNQANLSVSEGQALSLLGSRVVNDGSLSAPGGRITVAAIAGTNRVNLSSAGQILSVEVPDSIETLASLPAMLTGQATASADSLRQNADGSVDLISGDSAIPDEAGIAAVSGLLTTASVSGGEIQVFGEKVALIEATLDASGAEAGGNILVGGGYQGSGPLTADYAFVGAGSRLNASATDSGDAGQTIVWADGLTEFYGDITAQGGSTSGDGGFVEVSGADSLVFKGAVDTSATNGSFGTLLLDPKNIAIIGDGGSADGDDAGSNANALGSDPSAPDYTLLSGAPPAGGTFQIYESELEGMSGATNIELQATNNITVNDLPDNELLFQPGTGTITFTADADSDGAGAFLMNGTSDVIRAAGRDVTISGFSANIASIDTSATEAGGNITLSASGGDIKIAGGLTTDAENAGTAGDIRLDVTEKLGSIVANSSGVTLSATSQNGDGGNVSLNTAGGSIRTLDITTRSNGEGAAGDIDFAIAQNDQGIGQIDTSGGTLTATSARGTGGNVTLITAEGNIDASNINTESSGSASGNAGNITAQINSGRGAIDVTSGRIQATAVGGNGGQITLETNRGNIGLGNISTNSQSGNAGDLTATVNNRTGSIDSTVGTLTAASQAGEGGDISLTTQRGNISISDITTTASASSQTGGDISLTVEGNIGSIDSTTGELVSGKGEGKGGDITLTTGNGNVSAGNLDASSTASGTGGAIDIVVKRGAGSIDLSSANVATGSAAGDAGNVRFETARGSIQSRGIDAASGGSGRGGDITYTTNSDGSIDTTNGSGQTLDASSASGRGGNVELSSGRTNVTSVNANGSRGGSIRFLSDETNIADGSLIESNGGRLQFASLQPELKIRVGGNADSSASTLDITREDLMRVSDNLRYIIIGEKGNSGKITVVPETEFPARPLYRQRRSR